MVYIFRAIMQWGISIYITSELCKQFIKPKKSITAPIIKKEESVVQKTYSSSTRFKLVFLVPKSLSLTKPQLFNLSAAAVSAALTRPNSAIPLWKKRGEAKIALKTESFDEISEILSKARGNGLQCGYIDEKIGWIGIADVEGIDAVCGHLKLL